MFTAKDYRVQETHFDNLRRAAAHQAELDAARQSAHIDQPFYGSMLAGIGMLLVVVGSRLRTRYGTLADDAPRSHVTSTLKP